MTKQELIERLEELQVSELETGFASQDDAALWAAEVGPLLKFNAAYHAEFRERAQRLSLPLSAHGQRVNLKRMAVILHEAIVDLESGVQAEDEEVEVDPAPVAEFVWPQRPTLAWYWKHMPAAAWGWLIGIFITVLVASFGVGRFYEQLVTQRSLAVDANKTFEALRRRSAEKQPDSAPSAQASKAPPAQASKAPPAPPSNAPATEASKVPSK